MKFVADEMLGRLAKWMRILGYDTLYFRQISDYELLRLAFSEERMILTRDRCLGRKTASSRILLIHNEKYLDQIQEVFSNLPRPLRWDRVFSLCLECNMRVEPIPKEAVKPFVPEYVYKNQGTFHRCPRCQKIYWGGTHYRNSLDALKKCLE